jgi:predicted CXXCH cytochrome family protein
MDTDRIRTWGPVAAVLLLLPISFVLLRLWLPPIGGSAEDPEIEPVLDQAPEPSPSHEVGGSATCAGCHAEQHAAWTRSTHARAEGELTGASPLTDGALKQGTELVKPIRTIGVPPVVQFLVPGEGGRLQVTSMAYDPAKSEWFDVFGEERLPGEWGHWTGGGMTWNTQCASCHSTGVSKGWVEQEGLFRTEVAEHGVGCAACHGALPEHGAGFRSPAPTLDTCAACHSRRADLTEGFVPGERFLDHFAPQLVDSTDAFWPDGQVREEDFEWTAFVGSAMHAAGVTCSSCHEPHSGSLREPQDALCLGCHSAMPGFAAHDPHPEGKGAGCVGCHMPVTTYMQRDPRHDHGFTVPDPWTAVELGVPDPCTRCHTDRDARWALEVSTRWWGDLSSPRRARTVALARGKQGDPSAIPQLLSLLRTEPLPAWRAASAGMLEGFLEREEVRSGLVAALADPEPLVRFAAAGALSPVAPEPSVDKAMEGLLADPVRSVRVAAARGLRFRLAPSDPHAKDYATYLALASDTPAGLHERGTWALERGDSPSAVRDLARAVQMDARSPVLRDAYAVALASYGRPQDAAAQLREAVALAPSDGALWFRLGLGEAGRGDMAAAEQALTRASALQPEDVRTWYNLGLVRQQLGLGQPAIDALRRAVALSPDAESRYALASTLFSQGKRQEARAEAVAVLQLAPDHPGALQIRDQTEK